MVGLAPHPGFRCRRHRRGVDVVVDTVGAATWPIEFSAVRLGGKIVLCGITTGPEAMTNLRALYWNQLTIMGSTMGSDEDFRQMVTAVAAVRMKPVIDSVHPLEEIRQAARRMEAANQFGKIVLCMSD
jgi:NADPH:quinone reductase-like Zn-dependent oxidoreductase